MAAFLEEDAKAPERNVIVKTEEEDEVICEMDVVFSRPATNDEVHVLQYPLRHAKVGLGKDRRVTGVNIRPQYGRLEVQLSVFPDDPATAGDDEELIQPCLSSFDAGQFRTEEKNIGRIQKLRSRSQVQTPTCNYAIASIINNDDKLQFVLAPVHAVSQLRPTFDYLDQYDEAMLKQRVQNKMLRTAAEDGTTPKNEATDEVAPLQVSFKRRESERAAERRRNSHATLREREEGEAWINLEFRRQLSEQAKKHRIQLFKGGNTESMNENAEESIVDSNEGKSTYKDMFNIHTKGSRLDLVSKGTLNPQETSQRALRLLATNAAVIQVVAHARVIHFEELPALIGTRPQKELLTAVRVAAYCLRGCWVAKKGLKDLRRLPTVAERYDACRIVILNIFRTNRIVTLKMAEDSIGRPLLISEKAILSVLAEVAVETVRGKGWHFKLADDLTFKDSHMNTIRNQEAEWDTRVVKNREAIAKLQRQIQTNR